MTQKPKAIQGKVVAGYILLLATAVLAVWFVYQEILKTSLPDAAIGRENSRVIQVSDAIAALYAAENLGTKALLEGSE
ncbi:MAG: hypothetical protein EOO01_42810, partial [Chitinophagaceae bacterium]